MNLRQSPLATALLLAITAPALAALATTYDRAALSTIADNPAQAQERASLADRAIDAAAQALTSGRSGEAAFAIRATTTQAQANAYAAVDAIGFASGFCRRDIGWREVAREQGNGG